jgi:hypothetical protein
MTKHFTRAEIVITDIQFLSNASQILADNKQRWNWNHEETVFLLMTVPNSVKIYIQQGRQ